MVSLLSIVALAVATTLFLGYYLGKLPEAPFCPSCRGMTDESSQYWLGGRTLSQVSTTAVRQCLLCGWRGRMRWRPSAQRMSIRK